jgi:hypothetical protein
MTIKYQILILIFILGFLTLDASAALCPDGSPVSSNRNCDGTLVQPYNPRVWLPSSRPVVPYPVLPYYPRLYSYPNYPSPLLRPRSPIQVPRYQYPYGIIRPEKRNRQ